VWFKHGKVFGLARLINPLRRHLLQVLRISQAVGVKSVSLLWGLWRRFRHRLLDGAISP